VLYSFLMLFSGLLMGQDVITLRNHSKLNVKVVERTPWLVKYRYAGSPDGVIVSVNINQVDSIRYAGGLIDPAGSVNPRMRKPFGISVGLGYDPREEVAEGYWHLTADYFVTPRVDLEINAGTSDIDLEDNTLYFSAGATVHLNRNDSSSPFTPYLGLLYGAWDEVEIIQVPMGVRYCGRHGLSVTLRAAPTFMAHIMPMVPIELKLGWRF